MSTWPAGARNWKTIPGSRDSSSRSRGSVTSSGRDEASVIKPQFKPRLGTVAAIVTAAFVIVALGVLQYRWNQEASDATGVRLADALQLSMINWHLDLFRNLSEVCLTMRMPVEADRSEAEQYADRL